MRGPEVEVAVDALAEAVSRALRPAAGPPSTGDFSLHQQWPGQNENTEARLAALRVLGVDALTPFVLAGHQFGDADAELVCEAIRTHPAPATPDGGPLWHLRDWALISVLRSLCVEAAPAVPQPPPDACADPAMPWQDWSAEIMRLSSLALPGVSSPPREAVAQRPLDLGRGLTRAMLRRDHLGAARLARWAALDGADCPDIHLTTVIDHLAVLAADSGGVPPGRIHLELTLATLLANGGR
jgi:hypothetical protein